MPRSTSENQTAAGSSPCRRTHRQQPCTEGLLVQPTQRKPPHAAACSLRDGPGISAPCTTALCERDSSDDRVSAWVTPHVPNLWKVTSLPACCLRGTCIVVCDCFSRISGRKGAPSIILLRQTHQRRVTFTVAKGILPVNSW
jgi:hypothetical protein